MSLAEACGDEPGAICERVYDSTASTTAASVADWLVDRPLQIAVIWLVAWIVARVLRRIIGRFTTHLSGAMGSGTVRKVRERAPTVLVGSATPSIKVVLEPWRGPAHGPVAAAPPTGAGSTPRAPRPSCTTSSRWRGTP